MAVTVDALFLDPSTGHAEFQGVSVHLTKRECELLVFLIEASPKPHTSRELLRQVWGYVSYVGDTALVRTHVCQIRKKLGAASILYRKGWGYYVPA